MAATFFDEVLAVEAGGQVKVGQREPVGRTEPGEPFEDLEGVVLDAPAAYLVHLVSEPVGDEVGIGRDVDPEGLDVVTRVGDDGEVRSDHRLHAGRQLGASSPSREEDYLHEKGSPSGRPVNWMPAWVL